MNTKERIEFEEKLGLYMKEKRIDEVFQLMSERLLFDLPSDPKAYLLDLLKNKWGSSVTFVVSNRQTELDKGMLDEIKSRYPTFDFLFCSSASTASDVKLFLDESRKGVIHKYVFNFPDKISDVDAILQAGIYFDKMVFCADGKPVGAQKDLWDQYKQIAVKIGSSELYDFLKVRSKEQVKQRD